MYEIILCTTVGLDESVAPDVVEELHALEVHPISVSSYLDQNPSSYRLPFSGKKHTFLSLSISVTEYAGDGRRCTRAPKTEQIPLFQSNLSASAGETLLAL